MPNAKHRRKEKRLREREIKQLHEQIDIFKARIAAAEAARREKRNERIRACRESGDEEQSQIVPCIQDILNDSETELEVNCSEVLFDTPEDDEVKDVTDSIDCRIYEARLQDDRALRVRLDAQHENEMRRTDNSSYLNLVCRMDRQQQQNKHVLLPCSKRQSDWKDDWTYSKHVIGANERLRIVHAGRALARQRVEEAQAALRRRAQEQADIDVPRAA